MMKRGEIWSGAGPGYLNKPRPVVILQADDFFETDSITICSFTSDQTEASIRIKVSPTKQNGLHNVSRLMVDKITTAPRSNLDKKIGILEATHIADLEKSHYDFLGFRGGGIMSGAVTVLIDQLNFLTECDRLKQVLRKTSLIDGSRKENSAEHSWHLILTAMTLAQYANVAVDLLKVMQMFALHELGELGGGDTFHYHKTAATHQKEEETVRALFSNLPPAQAEEFFAIWKEFEDAQTPEAKFAQALDRIWPIIQNHANNGGTWVEFGLSATQVYDKNRHIDDGSHELWRHVSSLIYEAMESGFLKSREPNPAAVP